MGGAATGNGHGGVMGRSRGDGHRRGSHGRKAMGDSRRGGHGRKATRGKATGGLAAVSTAFCLDPEGCRPAVLIFFDNLEDSVSCSLDSHLFSLPGPKKVELLPDWRDDTQ